MKDPETVVLDPERLVDVCGADVECQQQLLSEFVDHVPQMLARIEASIVGNDSTELAAASHSLKGSSLALGAAALGGVCQEIEWLAHERAFEGAREAFGRARHEFTRFKSAARAYSPRSATCT